MKVVYNTKGFGLRLNKAEMQMFAALRGWKINTAINSGKANEELSSTNRWFSGVDWEEFRTDPLLVRLCEEGMLSNEDLAIREWDEEDYDTYEGGWTMETDYNKYERVYVFLVEPYEDYYAEYDEQETETQGETA
jgi:hypothetical protein